MDRGVSSPISATIIGMVMLILAIYTTYAVANIALDMLKEARVSQRYRCSIIRIANSSLYPNSTIDIVLVNEGPHTINEVRKIDIAVVIYIDKHQYTYLLKYCNSVEPGCWVADKIYVGSRVFDINDREGIRPGEALHIKASLPIKNVSVDYGYVVVFTDCSRAERVLVLDTGEGS
jgi:Holliday junction resolvase